MKTHRKNTIEILSIGNELLIGHTLDTNSNWIAKQASRRGWTIERVTQLRDVVQGISEALLEALKRSPSLIITVGGLGPTHDDMTLRGVSRALGKPLRVNKLALRMIRDYYHRLGDNPVLTPSRRKMATIPRDARPLSNPSGTAPGVLTQSRGTRIVCLPGVPREMKTIFKDSIIPILEDGNQSTSREAYLDIVGIIESALAPVLTDAQAKYPGLYFKSHPRGEETGLRSKIRLHIYSVNQESAEKIREATEHVLARLSQLPKRSA